VPAVWRRERTIARRSQPPRRTSTRKSGSRPPRLGQIAHQNEPVVTSKCISGRPLLTGSAPQTEFRATHSKQTTKKFLTGARTHISIFNFSPFPAQNLAQLIQRRRYRINPRRSSHRRNPYQIPKTVPPENSTVSLFLSRWFTRASLRLCTRPASKAVLSVALLPGSTQNIESDVTYSKQTTERFLPGATTTSRRVDDPSIFREFRRNSPRIFSRRPSHDSNARRNHLGGRSLPAGQAGFSSDIKFDARSPYLSADFSPSLPFARRSAQPSTPRRSPITPRLDFSGLDAALTNTFDSHPGRTGNDFRRVSTLRRISRPSQKEDLWRRTF
jgi:hypothetical protein